MLVVRGRRSDPHSDRAVTARLLDRVADTGESAVRVWTPPAHVAFGPRDAQTSGYDRARSLARSRGYPAVERATGGRAVAFTGSTVALAAIERDPDARSAIRSRYEAATDTLEAALDRLGVDTERGEPDGAFCPGTHSLQAGGKVAGVAQRVTRGTAFVGGVLVVEDREAVAAVLEPVYEALGLDFDPAAVGSLVRAGATADPAAVRRVVETALVADVLAGDATPTVRRAERIDATAPNADRRESNRRIADRR